MAQTTYSYATPSGVPGGILDIAPYEANSKIVEADDGVLKYGMGVVAGTNAGMGVALPAATTDKFAGVLVERAHEEGTDGKVTVKKGEAYSVMRWGRVWVRVVDNITVAAGNDLYLICTGDNAGVFTNAAGDGAVKISGSFVGAAENGIAPAALFNA